jgi:hypothetical protein
VAFVLFDLGLHTQGGARRVGDERFDATGIGRRAVARARPDHAAVVVNTHEQCASTTVGEADDGLDELGVIDVALELNGEHPRCRPSATVEKRTAHAGRQS